VENCSISGVTPEHRFVAVPVSTQHLGGGKEAAGLRTKLSTCGRKRRFANEAEALAAVRAADVTLRIYRCERCCQFHLTSRTKGKWLPRAPA
jgi:hypothetical protein